MRNTYTQSSKTLASLFFGCICMVCSDGSQACSCRQKWGGKGGRMKRWKKEEGRIHQERLKSEEKVRAVSFFFVVFAAARTEKFSNTATVRLLCTYRVFGGFGARVHELRRLARRSASDAQENRQERRRRRRSLYMRRANITHACIYRRKIRAHRETSTL